MATNSAGLPVSKDDVNVNVGAVMRDLLRALDRARALKLWKASFPNFGTDLQFAAGDATDITNAIDDADDMARVAGLVNIRKVAGLGNV